MDEKIKEMLEAANKNYNSALRIALNVMSQQPLCSDTDSLLSTLVQVEVTNGCLLAEILSLLNEPKDGDAE